MHDMQDGQRVWIQHHHALVLILPKMVRIEAQSMEFGSESSWSHQEDRLQSEELQHTFGNRLKWRFEQRL